MALDIQYALLSSRMLKDLLHEHELSEYIISERTLYALELPIWRGACQGFAKVDNGGGKRR